MATEFLNGTSAPAVPIIDLVVSEEDRVAVAKRHKRRRASVAILFPIYITIVNSLLTPLQIAARPPFFFPTKPTWGAY